jgi:hypothetical protein
MSKNFGNCRYHKFIVSPDGYCPLSQFERPPEFGLRNAEFGMKKFRNPKSEFFDEGIGVVPR